MDTPDKPLIEAIDDFVAKQDMSPITFGRKALGDPHFVAQLRKGRRVWPETEQKVRDFMAEYGQPTPSESDRPFASRAAA